MDSQEKIEELRGIIRQQLLPIIGKKVVLVDAPYYNNIGDVLIWQGITDFLKENDISLLETSSFDTFKFPPIDSDVTILLMGGGNFGDLWRWAQDLRLRVIETYVENNIIMFPQSVWYDNNKLIKEDAKRMASHKNLYLCARDKWSYEFLNRFFNKNNLLLVPDMAFYIDENILKPYQHMKSNKLLFFRRLDKELTSSTPDSLGVECDIRDWPTMEVRPKIFSNLDFLYKIGRRISKYKVAQRVYYKSIDRVANKYIREKLVKQGCEFLASYSYIATTRLHAMILGVLLHRNVAYLDNKTKKLSAFADTWLKDLSSVTPYETH